jgi:L-arabinose isomerase
MLEKRRPRIGLLGIMHGIYDEAQPGITHRQEKYAREVVSHLEDVAEVDFPRAAKNRQDIDGMMKEFNQKELDGVMIVNLLYCPGLWLVNALKENRLPLLLANIQPVPSVTKNWSWSDLTTNQGIHGAQDTANMITRSENRVAIITEDWKTERFKSFVGDWALAAQTAQQLKKARIVIFGRCPGMGDILGDDLAFYKLFGTEINHVGVGEVFKFMESATDEEIEQQLAEDRKNFTIDSNVNEEAHRYALGLQLGFEKFMREQKYDGFSAQCTIFKEDGRFKQLPLLGASNLLAKGYGYAGEGDTNTTFLTLAGHLLTGDPHFTEMYSLDFQRDSAFMSHMGEGNWKIARKDRPIRLIDRSLEIGELGNPPTLVFSAEPGPANLVSLVAVEGSKLLLVGAKGEILDTKELSHVPMPYFHFKPDSGIRECMDTWLSVGGTHHQVLSLGEHSQRWKMLCDIYGIEYVEV